MDLLALPVFTISLDWAAAIIFYVSLFVFVIHLLVLAYHWFSYNTDRTKSLLTLSIYSLGAAACLLLMAIMLNQM